MTTTPDEQKERDAGLTLALVRGVGPVAFKKQLADHARASIALERHPARVVDAARLALEKLRAKCRASGIEPISAVEERYPASLRALEDPPTILFANGRLTLCEMRAVAVVGARHASAYGRRTAHRFAAALARDGACVVSGLAAGIDAEAHAGALHAGGATIAVMGTGADVAYPLSNAALHARIARDGLVLSELPPGRKAHPGAFPRRNRIIAALADVVVVVEAGVRSGSLITAQVADAINRSVAAVPADIEAPGSMGSNGLLRDGAQVVTSPDDVLGLLALTPRGRGVVRTAGDVRTPQPDREVAPGTPERRVLDVLAHGPRFSDELARSVGAAPRDVGAALTILAISGLVHVDAAGLVRRL